MSDSPETERFFRQVGKGFLAVFVGLVGVGFFVSVIPDSPQPEAEPSAIVEAEPPEVVEEEPEPEEPSVTEAEMLAVIADVDFQDRDQTTRRFEFLLDAFSRMCPTEEGQASIPDRLVSIHQLLEDAGLDDDLLDMANSLHQLTSEISVTTGGEHGGCTDFWTAYALLRRDQGLTPERAVESVAGIYRALF